MVMSVESFLDNTFQRCERVIEDKNTARQSDPFCTEIPITAFDPVEPGKATRDWRIDLAQKINSE